MDKSILSEAELLERESVGDASKIILASNDKILCDSNNGKKPSDFTEIHSQQRVGALSRSSAHQDNASACNDHSCRKCNDFSRKLSTIRLSNTTDFDLLKSSSYRGLRPGLSNKLEKSCGAPHEKHYSNDDKHDCRNDHEIDQQVAQISWESDRRAYVNPGKQGTSSRAKKINVNYSSRVKTKNNKALIEFSSALLRSIGNGCYQLTAVIPRRFYLVCCSPKSADNLRSCKDFYSFNIENELVYENFYGDFGPLNLSMLYRYCTKLQHKLSTLAELSSIESNLSLRYKDKKRVTSFKDTSNSRNSKDAPKKAVVHWVSADESPRTNAAYLAGAFLIICLGKTASQASDIIHTDVRSVWYNQESQCRGSGPRYIAYRDAAQGPSTYPLTLDACFAAVEKACRFGWIDFATFRCDEYDHYEQVENGDLNWVLPGKLLAFCGPHSTTRIDNKTGQPLQHEPEAYLSYFRHCGVTDVVRLNKRMYDASRFSRHGFAHHDLYFVDGSTPSHNIMLRFMSICEKAAGAVAVHCKAGLGRTGTLIACYLMKHYRLNVDEAIAWLRICRPGSIIGVQQHWLRAQQDLLWELGTQFHSNADTSEAVTLETTDAAEVTTDAHSSSLSGTSCAFVDNDSTEINAMKFSQDKASPGSSNAFNTNKEYFVSTAHPFYGTREISHKDPGATCSSGDFTAKKKTTFLHELSSNLASCSTSGLPVNNLQTESSQRSCHPFETFSSIPSLDVTQITQPKFMARTRQCVAVVNTTDESFDNLDRTTKKDSNVKERSQHRSSMRRNQGFRKKKINDTCRLDSVNSYGESNEHPEVKEIVKFGFNSTDIVNDDCLQNMRALSFSEFDKNVAEKSVDTRAQLTIVKAGNYNRQVQDPCIVSTLVKRIDRDTVARTGALENCAPPDSSCTVIEDDDTEVSQGDLLNRVKVLRFRNAMSTCNIKT